MDDSGLAPGVSNPTFVTETTTEPVATVRSRRGLPEEAAKDRLLALLSDEEIPLLDRPVVVQAYDDSSEARQALSKARERLAANKHEQQAKK